MELEEDIDLAFLIVCIVGIIIVVVILNLIK